MSFVEVSTLNQVWICTLYVIAIILEMGCTVIAFLSKGGKKLIAFFIVLSLLSSIQMFMMIELFYKIEWGVPVTEFTYMSAEQNVIFTVVLLIIMLGVSIFYSIKAYRKYKKEIGVNSIKEAFDNLPKAISIINQKGVPVLVNKQMYDLVYDITEKDFQSLDDIADILNRNIKKSGIEYLSFEYEYFGDRASESEDLEEGSVLLKVCDKGIWQIKQKEFIVEGDLFLEVDAIEVTPIYNLSCQLKEKNKNLREQKKIQEKILKDMIQSKKEEEILNLKIDTHSKLGKAILATQLFLDHKPDSGSYDRQQCKTDGKPCDKAQSQSDYRAISPIEIWQDVIQSGESVDYQNNENSLLSLRQLIDVSHVFGCNIILEGSLPSEENLSYLIITAMREAITNAVRHAKADELRVQIITTDSSIRVEIEDNSNLRIKSIKETGGLADLRKKIERSGGSIRVLCEHCVKIILILPKNEKIHHNNYTVR